MSLTNEITRAATENISSIDCDSTPEQIAEVVLAMEAWSDAVKESQKMLKEALHEWLNQQDKGTQLIIGTKKYYIGSTVTKKANDNAAALQALFEATGGDMEEVGKCISSGASAFKLAKCKQVLGDEAYKEQFTELVKKDVKGETVKTLKAVDTRFLPQG
jgi:hypothetical protein